MKNYNKKMVYFSATSRIGMLADPKAITWEEDSVTIDVELAVSANVNSSNYIKDGATKGEPTNVGIKPAIIVLTEGIIEMLAKGDEQGVMPIDVAFKDVLNKLQAGVHAYQRKKRTVIKSEADDGDL